MSRRRTRRGEGSGTHAVPGPPGHAPPAPPAREQATRDAPERDAPERDARPARSETASRPAAPEPGRSEDRPPLASLLADRVGRCPDVAELSGGRFGTVATYLPADRVKGVAVRDDEVEIAVVARYGRPLPMIAEEIRDAVAGLTGERRINVEIDDLVVPGRTRPGTTETAARAESSPSAG